MYENICISSPNHSLKRLKSKNYPSSWLKHTRIKSVESKHQLVSFQLWCHVSCSLMFIKYLLAQAQLYKYHMSLNDFSVAPLLYMTGRNFLPSFFPSYLCSEESKGQG